MQRLGCKGAGPAAHHLFAYIGSRPSSAVKVAPDDRVYVVATRDGELLLLGRRPSSVSLASRKQSSTLGTPTSTRLPITSSELEPDLISIAWSLRT
jgi:hypothetical protein